MSCQPSAVSRLVRLALSELRLGARKTSPMRFESLRSGDNADTHVPLILATNSAALFLVSRIDFSVEVSFPFEFLPADAIGFVPVDLGPTTKAPGHQDTIMSVLVS
jgi:hypothetical protein